MEKKLITDAQRLELKTRINNIKAKREELRKMQESLIAWLKSQKIDPKKWGEPKPSISIKPSVSPSVTRTDDHNPNLRGKPSLTPKATENN